MDGSGWTGRVYFSTPTLPIRRGAARGGHMLKKTAVRTALVAVLVLVAANAAGVAASTVIDWRALSLVTIYLTPFVLARYAPGVCLYRLVVLDEPDRHFAPELERARSFAVYAGRRLLCAGFIFTLLEVARILAPYGNASGGTSRAMSASLLAVIYALGLYLFTARAARAVAVTVRR